MMTEAERFNVLVYLCIGAVVGLALSGLFVYMSGNPFFWVFLPIAIVLVFAQGFIRTKKDLD
ncbi:MAG: hypothetical protein E7Z67_01780 [Thermoplasmata archaeon]|nr:hypothetical protein [Thermoplasmata archaeon]